MHIFRNGCWIQIALKSARMLKSISEELKDDSWNLSYKVDAYLFPRESFGSMSNPSSAIILLSALQNSSPPSPSTYFSKPSRIINSCLPKGRLNIDRCRLTISARGLILLVSPWRDAQYLSLKFSSANLRSDFSSIWGWNRKNREIEKLLTVNWDLSTPIETFNMYIDVHWHFCRPHFVGSGIIKAAILRCGNNFWVALNYLWIASLMVPCLNLATKSAKWNKRITKRAM